MFLLVSGRHVGAHPDGHQHGVSIQISINLGKASPHILHKKNCSDLNLGESPCTVTFPFSGSRLNLLNGFYFFLIYLNGVTLKTSNGRKIAKMFRKREQPSEEYPYFREFPN